ncbi:MAG TPA: hypothetical protein VD965_00135 [Burkholderiales bacterium]|nr:hypothetical protein [Burkholderiales bacterium]
MSLWRNFLAEIAAQKPGDATVEFAAAGTILSIVMLLVILAAAF